MSKPKPKVSEKKKQVVAEFTALIDQYPVIGAVDVENLPALQLNRMRASLRDTVVIRMTKRRLLKIALENSKKESAKELIPHLKGMPALIFTKDNPFKLFKILKKNKSNAPIKAGQTAPNDIIVPKGPTSFAPGPIIGELGALKIKAGIDAGKVAIKEDAVVAKEGDVVSQALAGVLTRLGIEPMEIGLNLSAVWENESILTKQVLDVDEDQVLADITTAATWAFNLAMESGFATKDTVVPMLTKAHMDAFSLATEQNIINDETKELILAKAERQALALKDKVPENTTIPQEG